MSIFGSQLASAAPQSAAAVPLPISMSGVAVLVNGVPAPLYYASPTQLNVQIPYETAMGSAVVSVNNNGKVATHNITVSPTGPGIFTDANDFLVPTNSIARGQEVAFYMTGVGAVTPALFTGSAPDAASLSGLPAPAATPLVGNLRRARDYRFRGHSQRTGRCASRSTSPSPPAFPWGFNRWWFRWAAAPEARRSVPRRDHELILPEVWPGSHWIDQRPQSYNLPLSGRYGYPDARRAGRTDEPGPIKGHETGDARAATRPQNGLSLQAPR